MFYFFLFLFLLGLRALFLLYYNYFLSSSGAPFEKAFSNVNNSEKYLLVNNGIIKNIRIDARHVEFCVFICNINFLLPEYAVPENSTLYAELTPFR